MAVPELNKPVHRRCVHQIDSGGCGIYSSRPKSCVAFVCLWLGGQPAGEELRPDRCGLMLWNWRFQAGTAAPQELILAITESTPGALHTDLGKMIVNQAACDRLVLIIPASGELRVFTADATKMNQVAAFGHKLEALSRSKPDA
jgi:hypothetical protein